MEAAVYAFEQFYGFRVKLLCAVEDAASHNDIVFVKVLLGRELHEVVVRRSLADDPGDEESNLKAWKDATDTSALGDSMEHFFVERTFILGTTDNGSLTLERMYFQTNVHGVIFPTLEEARAVW